jgi:hypothetical protein
MVLQVIRVREDYVVNKVILVREVNRVQLVQRAQMA